MNKFFTSKVAFNIVIAAAVVLVFLTQSGANSSALGVPAGRVLGDSTSAYAYPSGSVVNDQGTIYFLNGTVKIPFTNSISAMLIMPSPISGSQSDDESETVRKIVCRKGR